MATRRTEKYSRIMFLLSFGCSKVTRSYIMKQVRITSPSGHNPSPWTLDDFLKHNKSMIKNTYFGSRKETQRQLFPPSGGNTEFESWDLKLLCFVFLELCNPSIIVKLDYDNFMTMRNCLCHTATGVLSDSEFSVYMVQLTIGIRRCLTDIQDPVLTTEIEQTITAVKTYAAQEMERFIETEMKGPYTTEMDALERVEQCYVSVEREVQLTTKTIGQNSERIRQLTEGQLSDADSMLSEFTDLVENEIPSMVPERKQIQLEVTETNKLFPKEYQLVEQDTSQIDKNQDQVFLNTTQLSQDTKGDGVTEVQSNVETSTVQLSNAGSMLSESTNPVENVIPYIIPERKPIQSKVTKTSKLGPKEYQPMIQDTSQIEEDAGSMLSESTNPVENVISSTMPGKKTIRSEVTDTSAHKHINCSSQEQQVQHSDAGSMLSEQTNMVFTIVPSTMPIGKQMHSEVTETNKNGPKEYQPIKEDTNQIEKGMSGHSTFVPARQSTPQLQNIKGDDPWALIGEQIYYDPKTLIGTGSMSAVFEGRYGAGKLKKIAVKRIVCAGNEEAKNRYREIAMITNLIEPSRDPNIVDFIHSYTDVNVLYIAFELGIGTLVDYVNKRGELWRDTSKKKHLTCNNVNRGISEGLNYIHNKSVVHRDLKPQNIFIVERNDGDLKAVIGDFGSAKETNGSLYSLTGRTGSLGFIAPEVFTAMSQDQSLIVGSICNRKSDIFATGLLFYYTIALGDNAFGHALTAQMAIQAQNPPTLGKIDQIRNSCAHKSLIACMLNARPEERPSAKTVLSHPANWPDIKILNYLTKKSDEFEDMITTDPSNTATLEDPMLIPKGNWMNNLPPGAQTYLKAYKVNKGSPPLYKGKESSIRSLLRVIRNTNSHYKGYPQNVKLELGDYPEGHVDLWLRVCPKLLMHVVEKLGIP